MSHQGWFDKHAIPSAWFATEATAKGWFDELIVGGEDAVGVRALYWNGSRICQVTDALVGTGLKPLVLLNGIIKERAASEGVPLVFMNDAITTLPSGSTLLI